MSFSIFAEEAVETQAIDLQVLIDVSGSMKQNDPENIRIPALKLLVNLLPPGSEAGLWIFAEQTAPLIVGTRVDPEWKESALNGVGKIHSKGLFTNIEEALIRATKNWSGASPASRRSVILLTDGVVDVSKDPEASRASRDRIINQHIPRLQQVSAQVHTIALSDNADHDLLKKIAFDTGGWNKSVRSASELQRVFLKMFKKAVPRDSVPLVDNTFTIDAGIDEFSVLVFRKAGSRPTRLIDPRQAEFTSQTIAENTKWQVESDYDLITVVDPPTGSWKLDADLDPDNQVMVVTDLKLILDELPNYVSEKEPLSLSVSIADKGQRISRMDFLELVDITIKQTDELDRTREWKIRHPDETTGRFVQSFGETLSPGRQRFQIVANGKTFTRETEYTVDVVENPVSMEVSMDEAESGFTVHLSADSQVIDPETLRATARIVNPNGETTETEFQKGFDGLEATFNFSADQPRTVVNFVVSGTTLMGNSVTPKVRPLIVDEDFLDGLSASDAEADDDKWEDADVSGDESEDLEDPHWVTTAILAVAINLVLIVGGYFTIRFMKKRSENEQRQLIERLAT